MTYATKQDLIDRFGETELIQRTDRTNVPPTTVDDDVVAQHLADAFGMIDGYVAKRYTLPLATVPASLRKAACDMARFYILAESASDGVRKAFDDAVKLLRDIADGRVQLDAGDGDEAPAQSGGPTYEAPRAVFGDRGLSDFLNR